MPKLEQKRVQDAVDKAFDAEVARLFNILLESLTEVASGAGAGGVTREAQCVGTFSRNMKRLTSAYDKACEVAEKLTNPDAKP